MELQKNGDALAEMVLKRYESRLSRGLAMVANLLDPDIFVLGGGMSNIERLYQTLPKMIPEWTFGKDHIHSKSGNSPFIGKSLKGKVELTISTNSIYKRQ